MMARRHVMGLLAIGSMLAACSERDSRRDVADEATEDVSLEEYVSKTPDAKIYVQPSRDPAIIWTSSEANTIALVDTRNGDMILSQTADRERGILYFAYTTKDREIVKVFMTQFGGGFPAKRWKVYPIRVWNIEEAKADNPAVEDARERATLEHFAKFLSSWPDWEDDENSFMIIDAPVSEIDPL